MCIRDRGCGAAGRAPAERFGNASWSPRSGASGSTSIGPVARGACVGRLLTVNRRPRRCSAFGAEAAAGAG
eukprot:1272758-Alexandrium_andersonii.AAC.1